MHRSMTDRSRNIARGRSGPRRWLALLVGAALGASSLFGLAPAAYAASQVSLDNVQFVDESTKDPVTGITDGHRQTLQIDMSVPGSGPATPPIAGTIHLDGRLEAEPQKIDILGEDGEPAGYCLVSESQLDCLLFDEYVESHPYDLQATVYFYVWVKAGNTEDEDLEFTVGNTVTRPVEVAPDPGNAVCADDCTWPGTGAEKNGYWNYDSESQNMFLEWAVRTPSAPDGMEPGASVVVQETIDLNEFEIVSGYPEVREFKSLYINDQGIEQLAYYDVLPADEFSVSGDKLTVSFTVAPGKTEGLRPDEAPLRGAIYDVVWKVLPIDGWVSDHEYENKAYVTVTTPGGSETSEDSANVRYQGGGGNVIGSNVGRVFVAKFVEGDNAPPAGTTYQVDWKACDTANNYDPVSHDGADCRDGQVSIEPGADPSKPALTRIGDFPNGWRVVATEARPANTPPNTDWRSEWQWIDRDGNPVPGNGGPTAGLDVTIGGAEVPLGQAAYFGVTNTFTKQQTEGQFGAQKVIDDSTGFDLDGLSYTLAYSYPQSDDYVPGVSGFPAGSGSLSLPGTGEVSYSDTLPIGAVLTFDEPTMPDVGGVDWGTPTITPATLTIEEGTLENPALVTLTNTATPSAVDAGHFVVRKTINNPDGVTLPDLGSLYFTLNYDVQEPGEASRPESIQVPADGQLVSSPEYPAGTAITITGEDTVSLPSVPGAEWGTPTWTPTDSFTITSEPTEVVTVDLANSVSATVGQFQAAKAFGETQGLGLDHLDFALNYSYPAGNGFPEGSGTLVIEGDGTVATSEDLPIGAVLTFSEGDMPELEGVAWENAVITPEQLTITAGTNATQVVVTNALQPITPSPGRFTAQKLIDYPQGDDDLIDLTGQSFFLNYWYTVPGEAELGPFEIEMPADGGLVFSDEIPIGANVRVEEDTTRLPQIPDVDWGYDVTVTPSEFEMDETESEIHVTVTNTATKKLGHFDIAKAIVNPDDVDLDSVRSFTVNYDYYYGTSYQGSASLTLPADGSTVSSPDYPVGTGIRITGESAPPGVENATWASPEFSQTEFTIAGTDQSVAVVTVTNTIGQDPGTFSAYKEIVNDDGLHVEWFTFGLEYEYEFNGDVYGPFVMTLDADGDREVSPQIPIGAEVRILREIPPTEIDNAHWADPVIAPTTFTIPAAGAEAVVVQVENTLAVDRGLFHARKVVVNDEGVELPESVPGSEFPYQFVLYYEYTAVNSIPAGSGFMYIDPDGSVVTSAEIPYGATVTVMEVDPVELPGTTWKDPVLSTETFVMGADTDKSLEIVVENTIERDLMPFWATKTLNIEPGLELPDDIESFDLEYTFTYPWVSDDADPEQRGGTDTLTLGFDPDTGEALTAVSKDLPHGTEVSVREVLPEVPSGVYWQNPVITPDQFRIDAAAFSFVTVTAENTLSSTPPGPTDPTDPPGPTNPSDPTGPTTPPALEVTGMVAPWALMVIAAMLIVLGGYSVLRRGKLVLSERDD